MRPDLSANGKHVVVQAVNPQSVCCLEALLATALLSVGVAEHPRLRFRITEEEIGGKPVTLWTWLFRTKSADGQYETAQLVQWWNDPAWLAANPAHEWTILRTGLMNMAETARRIRGTVARIVVRRGALSAHIPANATPARREHLLGKLAGTVPMNQPFAEPPSIAA